MSAWSGSFFPALRCSLQLTTRSPDRPRSHGRRSSSRLYCPPLGGSFSRCQLGKSAFSPLTYKMSTDPENIVSVSVLARWVRQTPESVSGYILTSRSPTHRNILCQLLIG